ncbi:DUF805 domain-containing protein [Erythrobacter jejuensis]|uniref:DUF805 domain-containing protein n=2 Tax=Parerythrobacter jejuensis TaxID=795812 RepID=A0A845ATT5_9SPHN|nr:DUF805 domain-containing protein [Parerythrobacter jejuensis]MXP32919.1 DUF805 domain-containing protein [Parerythrobacter jejuensis]
MEWMILPFRRYFDFQGRSRRMEFWMFAVLNLLVYLVIGGLTFGIGGGIDALSGVDPDDTMALYSGMFSGVGLLFALWGLIVFIPSIAVSVRRLHDRDMSGWWYLGFIVASLIPFIGFLASLAFLVLMFLPGTEGPNRFGPDPKNPNDASVFE